MDINFLNMPGPFVLAFSGEGAECMICQTPREVVDYLYSEEGAGWGEHSPYQGLLDVMDDDDNWSKNELDNPFWFTMPIGEITVAHVIVISSPAKCSVAEDSNG